MKPLGAPHRRPPTRLGDSDITGSRSDLPRAAAVEAHMPASLTQPAAGAPLQNQVQNSPRLWRGGFCTLQLGAGGARAGQRQGQL